MSQKKTRWLGSLVLLLLVGIVVVVEGAQNRIPGEYVDDVYHCDDPWVVEEERKQTSISCDPETYLWNVDELEGLAPPLICFEEEEQEGPQNNDIGGFFAPDMVWNMGNLDNVPDKWEPCVLWVVRFGEVPLTETETEMPPAATTILPHDEDEDETEPSVPPIKWAPNNNNNTQGTTSAPVTTTTSAPEEEESTTLSMDLSPMVLTYFWPDGSDDNNGPVSLDRKELLALTERHLLEALQAELGVTLVESVPLVLTSGVPASSSSWKETVTGSVVFADSTSSSSSSQNSFLPSSALLQKLARGAFEGNAMELYQFRLQIAKDATLRRISYVTMGTDVDYTNNGLDNSSSDSQEEEGFEWTTLMIAIVSSVGAALLAVCVFAYCLLCRGGTSRREKQRLRDKEEVDVLAVPTNPTGSHDDNDPEDKNNNHPHKPSFRNSRGATKASSNPSAAATAATNPTDDDAIQEDIELYETESVGTSVYSYLNDDASLLYSINEGMKSKVVSKSANHDDGDDDDMSLASKKKGLMWNVMDTFSQFGDQNTDGEDDGSIRASKMLGAQGDDDDDGVEDDDDDKSFLSIGIGGIMGTNNKQSPVKAGRKSSAASIKKEQFEALWRDDDAKEDQDVENQVFLETPEGSPAKNKSNELVDTLRTSNRTTVIRSPDGAESPSQRRLVQHSVLSPKVVSRTPEGEEDRDGQNVSLPLPSNLNTSRQYGNVLQDAASVHSQGSVSTIHSHGATSVKSNKSTKSNASQASNNTSSNNGRPLFKGDLPVESARQKRRSPWNAASEVSPASSNLSVNSSGGDSRSGVSAVSTDSAKYRSLLNQGDINDGALFFDKSEESSTDSGSCISATKLNYDTASECSSILNGLPLKPIATKRTIDQSLLSACDSSDDDEDLYVDGEVLDDKHATTRRKKETKQNSSSKSTGSSSEVEVVYVDGKENHNNNKNEKSFANVEKRLPFESEPNEEEEKKDAEDDHLHYDHCGQTMASF